MLIERQKLLYCRCSKRAREELGIVDIGQSINHEEECRKIACRPKFMAC
jgi:hypothetical protein